MDNPNALLSCYTANLVAYLERCFPHAANQVARSVRLAVRRSPRWPLAFSHHDHPLNQLPDGTRLTYRWATSFATARGEVESELEKHGQVLLVARSDRLPWSAQSAAAPHFVLLTGRDRDGWRLADNFTGLFPDGVVQSEFAGTVSDRDLKDMLAPIASLRGEHRLRNRYAFGHASVVPPDGTFQWVVRTGGDPARTDRISASDWCLDTADSLSYLAGLVADSRHFLRNPSFTEDLWAAARHHLLRNEYLVAEAAGNALVGAVVAEAGEQWRTLPQILHIGVASAVRGRPRPALVPDALTRLARTEQNLAAVLSRPAFAGVGSSV
ncbi:hypothetical protein [Actinokineospora sp. UTMC 2448]|uniref:hypothetical protein n=1 Tax=Actinokineospora sp. UTMC 2448 TaxID=2268449 RepID=UPI002164E632|nr:hypothetical protein [Actinokineospora sp. UTMC 2448]UVS79493.1 hypothetical protein Actkin_03241 [Actinokineospora sp. UTMC 2448]